MEPLGKVRTVSRSGMLIVRAPRAPPIGAKVFDERMARIGAVYDVIGPVSKPYAVVKVELDSINPRSLVGRVVYIKPKKISRKRKRR